jgi:hypothetical protein
MQFEPEPPGGRLTGAPVGDPEVIEKNGQGEWI